MDTTGDGGVGAGGLTTEDRAAMRAFLQRSEVRVSSVHRAATALLSGAGVLVLLPALGRDALVTASRALLAADRTVASALLLVSVIVMLAAIVTVLWLLLVELTRFYFHSNHLAGPDGMAFAPRFGLSSLRLPSDELSATGTALLAAGRAADTSVELLVPPNDRARRRIDRQVAAHAGAAAPGDDAERASGLLALVGAHDHGLAEEVARAEYGMARHTQRLQVIVLRYMKALLVVITSLLVVLALAGVLEEPSPAGDAADRWATVLMLVWSPAVMVAASSPIRWLGALLQNEGATRTGIRYDPELTRLERVMAVMTTLVTGLAAGAAADMILRGPDLAGAWPFVAAVVVGILAQGAALLAGRRAGNG